MPVGVYKKARGEKSPFWKGGISTGADGRVVTAHVAAAERALGKRLPKKAVVHHVDENKKNNRNDNLVICQNQKYHILLHTRMDAYRATGNPEARRCVLCRGWERNLRLGILHHGTTFRRRRCHRVSERKRREKLLGYKVKPRRLYGTVLSKAQQ